MSNSAKYKAVDAEQLRAELGRNCSPDPRNSAAGYVIGPLHSGRVVHWATCSGIGEARRYAAELNSKAAAGTLGLNREV